MRRWIRPRPILYAAAGAILSVGVPTGLLALRELYAPRPIAAELLSDWLTYSYVLIVTAVVFAVLGFALGRQTDRLAELSETDALTGLPNRRALIRHLVDEHRRSTRYQLPMSLLLVDVDGLKQVNDTGGHSAGDRLLRDVAAAIARNLRETDFAARWGGDEFAVVALNTSVDAARRSAERLVRGVEQQTRVARGRPATVSVGVASFEPARAPLALDALIRAADAALYRAKAAGRNRVEAA